MNILVFSWRDPKHPLAGGAEQVMHEHMKGWVIAGHKVILFSARFKNSLKKENIDGITVVRSGHQYLGVQLAGILYYLRNKEKYDFIVDQFHGIPFFTPLYVRKPKVAVVQEIARKVWFLNPLPWPINLAVGLTGYLTEPFIFFLYKNTAIMTGSQSAKKDVINFGIPGKNITVVPHGVVVTQLTPLPQKEKTTTVVYLGVLSKDKGIEDAIRCFSLLDKVKEYNFWVIGKPETRNYSERIKQIVKEIKLTKKIKFWGFVTQAKKFELLARAHILINPSAHEGWGLVNIEANSVGTPVVAYRSQGLVDSVSSGQSGVFATLPTPESLAETVISVLVNKQRYKALQKGAVAWSKKFSWDRSVALSLKLIDKVMMH